MALCCSRLPLGVSACACVCPIFHLAGGGLSPCTVRMRRGLGNPVSHDLASNKERSPPGAARRLPPLPKASERVGSAGSSECFKPQFWPAAGCPFEGHEGLLLQIGGGWLLFRVSVGPGLEIREVVARPRHLFVRAQDFVVVVFKGEKKKSKGFALRCVRSSSSPGRAFLCKLFVQIRAQWWEKVASDFVNGSNNMSVCPSVPPPLSFPPTGQ